MEMIVWILSIYLHKQDAKEDLPMMHGVHSIHKKMESTTQKLESINPNLIEHILIIKKKI